MRKSSKRAGSLRIRALRDLFKDRAGGTRRPQLGNEVCFALPLYFGCVCLDAALEQSVREINAQVSISLVVPYFSFLSTGRGFCR